MKWMCGSKTIELNKRPLLMGILNMTPDSFSGGCRHLDEAMSHAEALLGEGADILDIGGESTRPGSESVSLQEEMDRVIPLIQRVKNITDRAISIDTQKAEIAMEAIDHGAEIINHVSGSLDYLEMLPVLQKSEAGYIGMHMKARPKKMQNETNYHDVVQDVADALIHIQDTLVLNGVNKNRLVFDPGIGFGKTPQQCLTLLRNTKKISGKLSRPLLMGLSRKAWINHYLNVAVHDRDHATGTASALLPFPEVAIHRVHNVKKTRQSLVLKGLQEARQWDWNSQIYT